MLSVLHPKFSGMLGEALDVAARWSGDVVSTYVTNIFPVFFFCSLLVSWFSFIFLFFFPFSFSSTRGVERCSLICFLLLMGQ